MSGGMLHIRGDFLKWQRGARPVPAPLTTERIGPSPAPDQTVVPSRRSAWLAPLLVGCFALAVRLIDLGHATQTDELYHLLAAQSWLADGQLRVVEGIYSRAALFTIFLAYWLALLGDSLVVARLPSVIFSTALVVVVFLWARAVAGTLAAAIAAVLLALNPETIQIAQFVRFYALHGLLFWLGAIATYRLVMAPPQGTGRVVLLASNCVICFGAALYLQITTLIGLMGVVAWAVVALGLPWFMRSSPRARWGLAIGAVLLGATAVVVASAIGLLAEVATLYRAPSPYEPRTLNEFWYYHVFLTIYYPTLWPLVALAVVVGLAYRPRPTAFCASIVAIAFVMHSFGGRKNMRYLDYALPFLFVLWGIALAEIWPRLRGFLEDVTTQALAWLRLGWLGRPGVYAALAVVLLFTVAANGAFVRTTANMFGIVIPPMQRSADWAAASEQLGLWLADADIVLTTSELEALYHLGRYDVLISAGRLREFRHEGLFGLDPRTGRPVIADSEALALLIDCYPDGLIVTPTNRWRTGAHLDDAVADLVLARTEEVDLAAYGMMAFGWRRADDAERAEACARLPAGLTDDVMARRERSVE